MACWGARTGGHVGEEGGGVFRCWYGEGTWEAGRTGLSRGFGDWLFDFAFLDVLGELYLRRYAIMDADGHSWNHLTLWGRERWDHTNHLHSTPVSTEDSSRTAFKGWLRGFA
jgi:hypothetical protein